MVEPATETRYANGDVVSVTVSIRFYPSQWAYETPRSEPYTFECIGVVRMTKKIYHPKFYVDGAVPDKPLPIGSHSRVYKGAITKPLAEALEAEMGIPVVPIQANVIGEGR